MSLAAVGLDEQPAIAPDEVDAEALDVLVDLRPAVAC